MEKRNQGIDLLRIVSMFMICMVHVFNKCGVMESSGSILINNYTNKFIYVLAICGVDIFALISGYVSNGCYKKRKIISMWLQVIAYSGVLSMLLYLLGYTGNLTINEIIKYGFFPITSKAYWYFSSYFGLVILMPFINKFLINLTTQESEHLFLTLIILFSIVNVFCDPFMLKDGYSITWIIVLYILGLLAKKLKILNNTKTHFLLSILLIVWLFTFIIYAFLNINIIVSYTSPCIVCMSILMIIIFSRIDINSKLIKGVTPCVFGVYLLQCNKTIWYYLSDILYFVGTKNLFLDVLYIFIFSTMILLCGVIVDYVRIRIFNLLHIDRLSKKIENVITIIYKKITTII